jgi:DNA-3-methyladenine glycosylase II
VAIRRRLNTRNDTSEAAEPAVVRLTRTSLATAAAWLAERDAGLDAIIARHGPPPLWARPAGFGTLARIVLEQQVSLVSAATLYRRVAGELPGGWTAEAVLAVGFDGLRARGLTRQKAAYVTALAGQIVRGELLLPSLLRASDAEASAALMRVPGIGPWSASIYLLMALRRPDIWPPGDLALHRALVTLRRLPHTPSSDAAARLAERWAPYRAVAARILWHGYLAGRPG